MKMAARGKPNIISLSRQTKAIRAIMGEDIALALRIAIASLNEIKRNEMWYRRKNQKAGF